MEKVISKYNQEYFNKLTETRKKELEDNKITPQDKVDFLKDMAEGDIEKQNIYGQGLVGNVNYAIEANILFTDFLKRGIITTDERTWYYTLDEPLTDNEARVYEISNHGTAPREAVVMERDVVRITPYWITSPEVSMHRFSLRQGDISNEEKMRKRAEKGLAWDTEDDAIALLENGLFTDISTVAGIDIDNRIKSFPGATDIDLTTISDGTINLEVIKAILKHFSQMNKMVETIYVPVDNLTDLWDWMTLPAGYSDNSGITADKVVPRMVQEQIVRTGTLKNVFGYPVNLQPVNTLNGDTSEGDINIWAKTTEPCGEYRVFPGISFPYSHEDAKRIYYQINRALAMFQTPKQRLNYARFKIASEAQG